MNTLRRTISAETRVLDAQTGLVEYVASDESIDSYREVIRAAGWRFNRFARNAPFVDSHDYSTIDKLLGQVVDFKVAGGKLIETVQWAKNVPENSLAQKGWAMTEAGYLKAVSVGFVPEAIVTSAQTKEFKAQLEDLGLKADAQVRTIYTRQQQLELSAVIIGANPNALQTTAKAYKAGVLDDAAIEFLASELTHETAASAVDPAGALAARQQAREGFLRKLQQAIKHY